MMSSSSRPTTRFFDKSRHELCLEYWTGTFVFFLIIDLILLGLTVYVWDKLSFWDSVVCVGLHAFIIWLTVSCIIDKRRKRKDKEESKENLKEEGSDALPYNP